MTKFEGTVSIENVGRIYLVETSKGYDFCGIPYRRYSCSELRRDIRNCNKNILNGV